MNKTQLLKAFFATSTWMDSSKRVFHFKKDGNLVPLTSMDVLTSHFFSPNFSKKPQNPPKFTLKQGTATLLDSEYPYPFGIVNDYLAFGKEVTHPFEIELDSDHKVVNLTPYFCNYVNTNRGFYMTRNYTTKFVNCTRSDIYLVPTI